MCVWVACLLLYRVSCAVCVPSLNTSARRRNGDTAARGSAGSTSSPGAGSGLFSFMSPTQPRPGLFSSFRSLMTDAFSISDREAPAPSTSTATATATTISPPTPASASKPSSLLARFWSAAAFDDSTEAGTGTGTGTGIGSASAAVSHTAAVGATTAGASASDGGRVSAMVLPESKELKLLLTVLRNKVTPPLAFTSCASRLLARLFAQWLDVQEDLSLFERYPSLSCRCVVQPSCSCLTTQHEPFIFVNLSGLNVFSLVDVSDVRSVLSLCLSQTFDCPIDHDLTSAH
jgi:hypothetical protein